jgi:hypothetical protein
VLTYSRYWRIVALSDSGRSPAEIVEQVMKTSNVLSNARWLIIWIVDSVVENLHLIQRSGFNPDDNRRISRASIIINHKKPIRFSAFRPSKLSARPQTTETWEQLHAAQEEEAKVVTEALKLLSHKEAVGKQLPDRSSNRVTEAVIDGDIQAILKTHEVLEAEIHRSKKVLKKNRMTII